MKVSDLRELARARRMRGLLQVKEGRADWSFERGCHVINLFMTRC
jgi:hypothetical protein